MMRWLSQCQAEFSLESASTDASLAGQRSLALPETELTRLCVIKEVYWPLGSPFSSCNSHPSLFILLPSSSVPINKGIDYFNHDYEGISASFCRVCVTGDIRARPNTKILGTSTQSCKYSWKATLFNRPRRSRSRISGSVHRFIYSQMMKTDLKRRSSNAFQTNKENVMLIIWPGRTLDWT